MEKENEGTQATQFSLYVEGEAAKFIKKEG
jgi:hypothetical protein